MLIGVNLNMAFKDLGIDFEKILWEEHRIKYGPEGSYCTYPRRYKLRGFRANRYGEKIVKLEFSLVDGYKGDVVQIEEGGVTGYEDYGIDILSKLNKGEKFYLCAGCDRYDSLYVLADQYSDMVREMVSNKYKSVDTVQK